MISCSGGTKGHKATRTSIFFECICIEENGQELQLDVLDR